MQPPATATDRSRPSPPTSTAFTLHPPVAFSARTTTRPVHRRARRPTSQPTFALRRTAFCPASCFVSAGSRSPAHHAGPSVSPRRQHPYARESDPPSAGGGDESGAEFSESDEWIMALEGLFLEALKAYYQGTPMFSDSEFETLRDELDYLGTSHLRLDSMEKIWVQATSARDFDRRVREEFEMSEDELKKLKSKLLKSGIVKRPTAILNSPKYGPVGKKLPALPEEAKVLHDAQKIELGEKVDERLKWLLFSDASEERFKILLLYLPAVLMSFVTASVFTILFALLDGEMKITVTSAGRFRLGVLSYVVVMLTIWFSNQVTPVMLDYLDLGQPTLMRGECPICASPVSCLFTGAVRSRDERKCRACGSVVGFNRKWSKVYLVSPPVSRKYQDPD